MANLNVAQTFSSTISNTGPASTGSSFTNLFQTSPVSNGASGVVDYPVAGMAAIGAGGNSVASKSITFSSAGTIYMRACADKSSAANTGTITEINENNNCSAWIAVTVNNPPVAPVITGNSTFYTNVLQTFNATSTDPEGDTVRYGFDWNNDGVADNWVPLNPPYSASGTTMTSGTNSWPTAGSYSVKALAQDFNGANSSWSTFPITVKVLPPAASSTITVSPSTTYLNYGQSVTLSWSSTNANYCTLKSNFDTSTDLILTNGLTPTTNNSLTIKNMNKTTIYSLYCSGDGGDSTQTATVKVGKISPTIRAI